MKIGVAAVPPCVVSLVLVLAACNGGSQPPTTNSRPDLTPPGIEGVMDLSRDSPVTSIYAADPGDIEGDQTALAVGDFNDDGRDDILLGARFGDGPDNHRPDAGEAVVIFGADPPPAVVEIGAGQQGLTVYGALPGDGLGFQVAAGDINADGIDDLLVGAPFAGRPRRPVDKSGAVYVIFGRQDLTGTIDLADGPPAELGRTITGPANASLFGDSIATGDINGDGTADIVAGAPFAEDTRSPKVTYDTGAAFVLFGGTALPASIDLAAGDFDAAVFGAEGPDELGDAVAAGDLNGDTIGDLVLAAEAADGPGNHRDGAGEVYVFFGSRDFSGRFHIESGDQDVTIIGAGSPDTLGFSVAAGDLDGDTTDDLALGARLADGPDNARHRSGEVYVLFGPQLTGTIDLAEPLPAAAQTGRTAGLTVYGADPADLLGSFVAIEEADGDAPAELILGVRLAAGPGNGRLQGGEAYALTVEDGGSFDTAEDRPRLLLYGAAAGDRFGSSLAAADFDGDGRKELVAVAQTASGPNGRQGAGAVFVIRPAW